MGRENLHCVPRVGNGLVDGSTLSAATLVEARLDDERRMMTLVWNDEEVTDYPYLWLRDSCQCEACFDEGPCARRLLVHELDIDSKPVHIQMDGATQQITLIWSDGHRSVYRYKWLQARSFKPDKQMMRARWNGRKSEKLWDSSLLNNIPTLSYDKMMRDPRTQYEWMTLLEDVGFVMLKGAPLESGHILKIGREIGFCRMTNYGDISVVKTKNNPSNLAYTTGTLMLHTDLAYYDYLPGMQMMHCIEQASGEGGKSLFVDGFLVAKQLREQSPEQFKILADTVFDFYDIGSDYLDYHQMSRHPTIKLDEEGNVMRIAYSTHSRDSFLRVPLESVEGIYKALNAFTQLLYHPRNVVPLKLQPGDICCFNNWRVLHGRIGYESVPGESRLLEHGYIDWDEMHSKRRVLKTQLGIPDEEY